MSAAPTPAFLYPVMLDLTGRPCLIVGGGAVAERKVEGLLAVGARVTVVSPWLSDGLLASASEGRLHWTPRGYHSGDVAGFSLVMLGTTPEGDAYTFAEYRQMLTDAGFRDAELHPLPPTAESAVIATS